MNGESNDKRAEIVLFMVRLFVEWDAILLNE